MTRLVLLGGGHAHLFVLRELAARRPAGIEVLLISPSSAMHYSAMLPGWMTGRYALGQCQIDTSALAARAGAEFRAQTAVAMDADQREITLGDGRRVTYDLVSLDVGSETLREPFRGLGERLIPIRPLGQFQVAWAALVEEARIGKTSDLAVVGGGAGGAELAMAARVGLDGSRVTLVTGNEGLLPTHGEGVRRRVARALHRLGVALVVDHAEGEKDGLRLGDGRLLKVDHAVVATGPRAPGWLRSSRLSLDAHGFAVVDAFHQSVSHDTVFAAGDVCSRIGSGLARSGVHAVRSGPVLAHNLLARIEGTPKRPFNPRRRSLYLLSTSEGRAVASWGSFSAEGSWVFRLKDAIDRRFIREFNVGPRNRTL